MKPIGSVSVEVVVDRVFDVDDVGLVVEPTQSLLDDWPEQKNELLSLQPGYHNISDKHHYLHETHQIQNTAIQINNVAESTLRQASLMERRKIF